MLYPEKPSMKDINTLPVVLSTKTSIWGKGKSSLGNALFNSLKSPHILTFPSFLGTGTALAIHSSWFTFLMNNTFSCLVTSFFIFKSHSTLTLCHHEYQCDVKLSQGQFQAYPHKTMQTPLEIPWGVLEDLSLFFFFSFFFFFCSFKFEPILVKHGFSSFPKLIVSRVGSIGKIFFSNFFINFIFKFIWII